jgi:RND family efflux transporter MFP subunit
MSIATPRRSVGNLLLCGLLCCTALGCKAAAKDEDEKTPPASVKWMEPRQLFIEEWTEIVGTTQPLPNRVAHVTAAVEGHVVSVLQDAAGKPLAEGQQVNKGDVLVRLDERVARANRDKVAADLADLKQQVTQADLAIRLDEIEARRLESLLRKSSQIGDIPLASQVELDKAQVALEEARSKKAGAGLRANAGEMQLRALDEQLQLYALKAPISGRLGRILVAPGQTLAVGAPVSDIIDIDKEIDLLCFVPLSIRKKLSVAQTVRIGGITESPVPGSAGADGKIVFIADQSEVDTGNFAVKVRFPNASLHLHGYVTLRARALTAPGRAAWTLPESALQEDQDPPTVVVVDDYKKEKPESKDGKEAKEVETGVARRLQAKTGIRDRVLGLVEILSVDDPEKKWHGSLENSKFVTEKGQGVRTGDPIRLEEEEEDEAPPEDAKKD